MNTDKDYFDSDQHSINSELIEIVPYQSSWAEKFQSERNALLSVLSAANMPDRKDNRTNRSPKPSTDNQRKSTPVDEPDRRNTISNEEHHQIYIEHIGSTSVVGLAAKPIVDLMIGIDKWRNDSLLERTLQTLGYVVANPPQQLLPNTHFLFRRDDRQHRTHHLHVVEHNSEFWTTRLLYRDYLRQNKTISALYGTLKTLGAEQHRYDRIAYNEFKAPFIRACIRAALTQKTREK